MLDTNSSVNPITFKPFGILNPKFLAMLTAIVPVMLYDAKLSQTMANMLLEEGIYVIGFFFPVVPREKARIRVQLSAAHEKEHLDKAIRAFTMVGKQLDVI